MLNLLLAFVLLPAATLAQVAGHGSVPSTGPAAQERSRQKRDDDPVVSRIDKLRSDLADVARRYRKAKAEERPALASRMVPLLDEMGSLVSRLGSRSAQDGVR
jgi:hypothetical protein